MATRTIADLWKLLDEQRERIDQLERELVLRDDGPGPELRIAGSEGFAACSLTAQPIRGVTISSW